MRLLGRVEIWKGLVPLPQAAAEILEGCLTCKGFLWRAWSLNLKPEHQSQEEAFIQHLAVKSSGDSVHQVPSKRANTESLIGSHSPWDPAEGGRSRLKSYKERLWLWLWERAERTAAKVSVLSSSPTPKTPSFVGGALPSIGMNLEECSRYPLWMPCHPTEQSAAWARVNRVYSINGGKWTCKNWK